MGSLIIITPIEKAQMKQIPKELGLLSVSISQLDGK